MDPQLERLLSEYIERTDSGETLSTEDFCREHPAHAAELRVALEAYESTTELFPTSTNPPQKIGRYEIIETIGRGGLGVVLHARDPEQPGSDVALKLLQPGALADARALERFRREGEALKRISHPNIVGVREVGEDAGQPFLAMDLVGGRPLDQWIRELSDSGERRIETRALPGEGAGLARILAVATPLAAAVQALHEANILHRDIKPQNVILEEDGTPVLVDFGLAGDEALQTMTRTGDVMGTLAYMAPEQARGERVDERADIYGLGAILYELVSLKRLHERTDSVHLLQEVSRRGPRPHSRLPSDTPSALKRVLYRCLAFRPEARYATVRELIADLEALATGRPVRAASPRPWERLNDSLRHHRRLARAAAVAVALVLVALISWGLFRSGEAKEARRVELSEEASIAWVAGEFDTAREIASDLHELVGEDALAQFIQVDKKRETALAPGYAALHDAVRLAEARKPSKTQLTEALANAENARAALPDSPLPPVVTARIADKMRDRERAAREYSIAVGLLPESAQIHYELSRILYKTRDYEASIRAGRKATEYAPEVVDYWIHLSVVCLRLNEHDEGLAAATRAAASEDPKEKQKGKHALAVFLDGTGKKEEAIAVFEEIYPNDPKSRNLCFSMALIYDRLCRHKKAFEFYGKVLELRDDDCDARLCLANLYAGGSRDKCDDCRVFFGENPEYYNPEKAAALCREALDIDHGGARSVVETTVYVMHKIGRIDEAITWLRAEREVATRDRQLGNLQRGIKRAEELAKKAAEN